MCRCYSRPMATAHIGDREFVNTPSLSSLASSVLTRCRELALHTEEAGVITRTFLSEPMRAVHSDVGRWMNQAGLTVSIDAVGNIRGLNAAAQRGARRLLIGSHLDTVPRAGAFDGILGVMLGIAIAEHMPDLELGLEVVGFSEEEGVRFGAPFIGSRALTGEVDQDLLACRDAAGISVREAIRAFGLDPSEMDSALLNPAAIAYLEFHIEQGPVLEHLGLPLGVVETIVGQSRLELHFAGAANHAGTTPMQLRRDALAGAAEWVSAVEKEALGREGLVATVGRLVATPGAGNVIAGSADVTLDIRHADDQVRHATVDSLLNCARQISERRGLVVSSKHNLDQPAVAMDRRLTDLLAECVRNCGHAVHRMPSGAGHDAMVLACKVPAAMLFVRSPGGISHHPEESALEDDVAAALDAGVRFVKALAQEKSLG
jgi:allantoate deiminase